MISSQMPPTNGVQQGPALDAYQHQPVGATEPGQPDAPTDNSFDSVNQVAWAFIEQYYTTLGKNPDKLYLLYKTCSYFTCGHEGESVPCGNGITQIQERVKTLGYGNARFRVSNIDAQPSDTSILIQAVGEFLRDGGVAQRFVQTFVLARQTNGYYVLNDIFRSLNETCVIVNDDQDEQPAEKAEQTELAAQPEPAPTKASADPAEFSTNEVPSEPKQEEPKLEQAEIAPVESSEPTEDAQPEDAPEAAPEIPAEISDELSEPVVADASDPEATASVVTERQATPTEPTAPEPTEPTEPEGAKPAAVEEAPKPQETTAPASPPAVQPPAPKTWASITAAFKKPAEPSVVSAVSRTPTAAPVSAPKSVAGHNQAPTASQQQANAQASSTTQVEPVSVSRSAPQNAQPSGPEAESDGWVAVGTSDSKRTRANPASVNSENRAEHEFRGYIKNVVASVTADDLRTALSKFDVTYLDISRQKNCAFVDFRTQQALSNAISSSPYIIGEERIFVEERRAPRPFQSRGGAPPRGGRNNGQQNYRGGFNKEGRGSFNGRGGRGHVFRGRVSA